MTTEIQTKQYRFQGNPVVQDVPRIGNLVYDERGEEILALHNERFRGISNIEDTHNYKRGQPLSYSNVPRVLSYEQILRERFPDMHVLSPEEVVLHWEVLPERDSTYADTNSIAVYPAEGSNESLRQKVLALTGKNKTKVSLMVSGLGIDRDAKEDYGFTFVETPYIEAKEAPFLEQDCKVSHNGSALEKSEEGVPVWARSNQSGLCRFFRDGSDWLDARDDYLGDSGGSGRVQILYDPQGRAENLEARLKQ